MLSTARPKPEPRKRTKRRAQRVESLHAQKVREACVVRDGDCRLNLPHLVALFGACSGSAEWCHMPEKRRSKTRGMAPEDRHDTRTTLMLCTSHHDRFDGRARPRIDIQPASSHGADGRLGYFCGSAIYVERASEGGR